MPFASEFAKQIRQLNKLSVTCCWIFIASNSTSTHTYCVFSIHFKEQRRMAFSSCTIFLRKKPHVEHYFNWFFYEIVPLADQSPDLGLYHLPDPISSTEEAHYTPRSPHYNYF